MLNNFIYAKTKDLFLKELEAGNVLDEAIVFIEDTKEIWNHGTYFDGKSIDISNIEESFYVGGRCEEIVDGAFIEVLENLESIGGWFSSPNPIMLILVDSYDNTTSLIGPYVQVSENALIFKFIGEYND